MFLRHESTYALPGRVWTAIKEFKLFFFAPNEKFPRNFPFGAGSVSPVPNDKIPGNFPFGTHQNFNHILSETSKNFSPKK